MTFSDRAKELDHLVFGPPPRSPHERLNLDHGKLALFMVLAVVVLAALYSTLRSFTDSGALASLICLPLTGAAGPLAVLAARRR